MEFKNITINELTIFLQENYIMESTNQFKLFYTIDVVLLALGLKYIILGLFVEKKLIGTITASESSYKINNKNIDLAEINFLCLDLEYRSANYASELINRITEVCKQNGTFIGFFTGINKIKKYETFSKINFFHRPINTKKLIKNNFLRCTDNLDEKNVNDLVNYYRSMDLQHFDPNYSYIKTTTFDQNLIKELYNTYLEYFKKQQYLFYQLYSVDEFTCILNNPVVSTYCIYKNDTLVDFFVYYVGQQKNTTSDELINCACIILYTSNEISLKSLFTYFIYVAYALDTQIDSITIINIMEFEEIVIDSNFKIENGTSQLYYSLYNLGQTTDILDQENFNSSKICKTVI